MTNVKKIKEWFDKHPINQDSIGTFTIELEGVKALLRRTYPVYGKAIDIACGTGSYTFLLSDVGFKVTGVDISRVSILKLRSNPRFNSKKIVPLVINDARHLPFKNGVFTVALCIGMLEYYPWVEKQIFLSEMLRVVRNGGYIIFDIPLKDHPKTVTFTKMEHMVGIDVFPESAAKVERFLSSLDCRVEKIQVRGFEQQFLVRAIKG